MQFQFDSFSAFLFMNGHGVYVWACYSITFFVLTSLVINPVMQKKAFLKQLKKIAQLEKKA
jgi:heme exporter protein D